MDLADAVEALQKFSGSGLTTTLSQIELAVEGVTCERSRDIAERHNVGHQALAAAALMKQLVGQINVQIHALGILLCLPHLLESNEVIESLSLGAGSSGKPFDLVTDQRLAEFKFITWRGSDAVRQNQLFKDFYLLAEEPSPKSKYLYLLDTSLPLKFLNGRRSVSSVLSGHVSLARDFANTYPGCGTVRDYYLPRRGDVALEDVSALLPELAEVLVAASEEAGSASPELP